MRRVKAFAALFLTAFFAGAAGFHHHPLPNPAHNHIGFCSQFPPPVPMESCAICRAAHGVARLAAHLSISVAPEIRSPLVAPPRAAVPRVDAALLDDSRAPPAC